MKEDFFFEFPGFHNINSKAHVRIVQDGTKPFVLIVSQTPDNVGTSVQNAYEILRERMKEYVEREHAKGRNVAIAGSIDDFANLVLEAKNCLQATVVFLLRQASSVLRGKNEVINALRRSAEIVWIEHWPPGTNMDPTEDDYLLVTEDWAGSPKWRRIDITAFSKTLGYDSLGLAKSPELFLASPNKSIGDR